MDLNNVPGARRTGVKAKLTRLRVSAGLAVLAIAVIRLARKRAPSPPAFQAPPSPTPAASPTPAPAPTPASPPPTASPAAAADAAPSVNGTAPDASAPVTPAPADVVAPEEQPDEPPATPLTPEEADAKPEHDVWDVVVAEVAETGPEDGGGPAVNLDAPWEGYDSANVEAVNARLADADADAVAVVELYEQAHKNRKTVLDAAKRRLKHLSS